jgi:hypothetical protein
MIISGAKYCNTIITGAKYRNIIITGGKYCNIIITGDKYCNMIVSPSVQSILHKNVFISEVNQSNSVRKLSRRRHSLRLHFGNRRVHL